MALILRDALATDEREWRALWAQYLAFYATDLAPAITSTTWARILDPGSRLGARVAADGALLGFAVWHHHVASWSDRDDCYLEDLFVAPEARGAGVGRAVIDDLIGVARTRGFGRIYWHTDQTNIRAQRLYDSYAPSDGHIRYRMPL